MLPIKPTAVAAVLALATLQANAHDPAQHQRAATPGADPHAGHAAPVIAAPSPTLQLKLPDALLTDQDGRARRLLSEVMEDKIIVANFVYTNCSTICPVTSTLFAQTQEQLGELLDSRVRLISLSVDPARDTPARLKTYAETHGAKPGWIWLTGSAPAVTATLKGFGTYTASFQDHPVVIMIGDTRSGQWTRYFGFQDPQRLANKVREVLAARELHTPLAAAGQK
jgi:protein SCO1/2